jgi:hypothetical protein
VSPDISTPYLQHYSLNIQHELARNLLLEIGYVGSKGTKLYTPTSGVNQPILASPERPVNGITTNTAANASMRVPWFGLSATGVNQAQTDDNSRYNSLQVSLTKRMSSGLQFLGSYTWAKSIDNTGSGDQTDARNNRGPSSFDRAHRFVYSYVYEIPAWGFGLNDSKFGSKFFSGWQITGVATAQTGTGFSITDSTGARLFGSTNSRASFAPGATVETATLSGPTTDRLDRYFNTAAFVPAGDYWGNTGTRIMRGPGQKNIDMALIKTTRFMENKSVEWRMEVFNLTNTPNFSNPTGNINSSAFGTINQTVANARLIQFGMRILY